MVVSVVLNWMPGVLGTSSLIDSLNIVSMFELINILKKVVHVMEKK